MFSSTIYRKHLFLTKRNNRSVSAKGLQRSLNGKETPATLGCKDKTAQFPSLVRVKFFFSTVSPSMTTKSHQPAPRHLSAHTPAPQSHLHLLSSSRLRSRLPRSPGYLTATRPSGKGGQRPRPKVRDPGRAPEEASPGRVWERKEAPEPGGGSTPQSANRCNLIRGAGRPQDFPESRHPQRPPMPSSPLRSFSGASGSLTTGLARAFPPSPPALPKCGPRGGRSLPGPATGTVTERAGDRASATARDTYLGEGRRRGA